MVETHKFRNIKVGDKVTCCVFGKGVVINIEEDNFPIHVYFETGIIESYNFNGYYDIDHIRPTLYHGHIDFNIEVTESCPYEVGEMIAVRDNVQSTWSMLPFVKKDNMSNGVFVKWCGLEIFYCHHSKLTEANY